MPAAAIAVTSSQKPRHTNRDPERSATASSPRIDKQISSKTCDPTFAEELSPTSENKTSDPLVPTSTPPRSLYKMTPSLPESTPRASSDTAAASADAPTAAAAAGAAGPGQGKQYKNLFLHNVALGLTPIAMASMFLPPRKLDFRTVVLGGTALWGATQLRYDYTGRSITQRLGRSVLGDDDDDGSAWLPEKARVVQARLREEKAARAARARAPETDRARVEGLAAGERNRPEGEKGEGPARRPRTGIAALIMGDAREDWKAERARKEREAMQEGGGGIWGLISDQVAEVVTGKKDDKTTKTETKGDDPKKPS